MTQDQNTPDQTSENHSSQTHQDKTASTDQPSPQPTKSKAVLIKIAIAIVVIIILAFIAYGLWMSYKPAELELQGRVEAETIYVSTKVPSRITELYVESGDVVKKGQPLVRLHSPEVDTKKQQALAALQTALALQSTVERGPQEENIESLYSNWQALKAQEELTRKTYQRGHRLFQEGVISKQRQDEMYAAAQSAADLSEAARQQYLRAKRGSTSQEKSTAAAQVDIARAAVEEVNALEAETYLHAPIDGVVSKTYGNVSELIGLGVPIVSIIDKQKMWVSLNVREDHYAYLYKNKIFEGFIPALNKTAKFKLQSINPQGDFATIKTTRQTGGYDIRSFKFHLDPAENLPNLKIGMSVLFKVNEAP
ncbi:MULTISPECIES: HlyD family secretion protein [unclassified Acinetobacter]|uniref:HlyD family secretion protein n=1 Tax=unclassified Acinetobacter TaxID=196816 RepID=UPI002935029F|nr:MULTISPECIES: efflux RND transporter periplasmic adaptor subunit [unclassified Acinetobacter]WOE31556.1 efflux RND transporter periplasmic adaptor subunit [Acinetobacter sp. SAAs470]WOE39753.1 efflux RND transporter periplasmic adaptor subunit [Acinetobacter sp. SAAs474]